MSALELVMKNYKGTQISATSTFGFKQMSEQLDCNCEDCGDDKNCGYGSDCK